MTVVISDITITMRRPDYALLKECGYQKCKCPKSTYPYKCDVKAFVNSMAANETFKSKLIRNMKIVFDLLSEPDCEVIRPITVECSLI